MATVKVKVEGFKELRDRARKLDGKLQRRVYSRAVRAGGKVVVKAAKAAVPVRTGSLRGSVVQRTATKARLGFFGVKVSIKPGKKASARTAKLRGKGGEYFPDAVERYYRFQELGTKFHPAKPFLQPALEGSQSAVLAAVREELKAGLEREAAGL